MCRATFRSLEDRSGTCRIAVCAQTHGICKAQNETTANSAQHDTLCTQQRTASYVPKRLQHCAPYVRGSLTPCSADGNARPPDGRLLPSHNPRQACTKHAQRCLTLQQHSSLVFRSPSCCFINSNAQSPGILCKSESAASLSPRAFRTQSVPHYAPLITLHACYHHDDLSSLHQRDRTASNRDCDRYNGLPCLPLQRRVEGLKKRHATSRHSPIPPLQGHHQKSEPTPARPRNAAGQPRP